VFSASFAVESSRALVESLADRMNSVPFRDGVAVVATRFGLAEVACAHCRGGVVPVGALCANCEGTGRIWIGGTASLSDSGVRRLADLESRSLTFDRPWHGARSLRELAGMP
jgi:hypothetical protein